MTVTLMITPNIIIITSLLFSLFMMLEKELRTSFMLGSTFNTELYAHPQKCTHVYVCAYVYLFVCM